MPLTSFHNGCLRQRDFRLFFIGQTTSTLGSSFTVVALAFAVLQATGSVADVGYVMAATRLPLTLFVLVGGVVGDRLPRRHVMLASDMARFLTQGIAALLLLTHHTRLWELLVLFALHGTAQAFFGPASTGLVPALVPPAELQQANATIEVGRNTASLLGQLLGGGLVAALGAGTAFAIDSGTFIVSACALALLNPPGAIRTRPAGAFLRELADGWVEFHSRRWLWVGVTHVALLNAFALVAFFALGPVVAKDSLGGAAAWGAIGAAFAAGMIGGNTLALRWRPRRPLLVAFAVVLLTAPPLALLALPAPTAVIAVAAVLMGAQSSLWSTLWTTTIQSEVPDHALARVSAYGSLGTLILAPAGFAVVGLVASTTGVAAVLWAGAAWVVASTVVVASLPCIRRFQAVPDTPAPAPTPAH